MNKYVLIFQVEKSFEDTEEMGQAIAKWYDSIGSNLLDGGNPFNPEFEAHVTATGVTHDADDAAGYSIISATDLDAAIAVAKACPLLEMEGVSLKVYQTMEM
jgi:hypothetical protein